MKNVSAPKNSQGATGRPNLPAPPRTSSNNAGPGPMPRVGGHSSNVTSGPGVPTGKGC